MGGRLIRPMATLATSTLFVTLLAGTNADAAPQRAAQEPHARPGDVVSVTAAAEPAEARVVRDFWTPARMRAAQPLGIVAPVADAAQDVVKELTDAAGGVVTEPLDEAAEDEETDAVTARRRPRVPRTAGKLFFTDAERTPYVCSAAAINTRRKNQVITAGHCVNAGAGGSWFGNWVFVPRYHQGTAPDGKWVGRRAWAFKGWINEGKFGYDQAIVAFKERKNRKLVRVVGGNGVTWGQDVRQRGVHVWGWPADAPYTGEVARRCEGRTTRFRKSDDAKIRCKMNGGASGGPWLLKKRRKANVGSIWAVTSRRTTEGKAYLIARPNPRAIRRMIRAAN